jgi:hypothetical protein
MTTKNHFYIDGVKIPMSDETAKSILDSQKPKQLTYKDIAKELFLNKESYWTEGEDSLIANDIIRTKEYTPNISKTKEQLESILALNKLCNVAKYLNDGWFPNYTSRSMNYWLQFYEGEVSVNYTSSVKSGHCYFKSKEIAQKAVDILGEDSIRKALTLNH